MKQDGTQTILGEEVASVHANGPPSASHGGKRVSDLVWSMSLSWMLAIGLLIALFYFGWPWSILAKTRLLDVLISAGVIKYHDHNMGFIHGVDDLTHYFQSQDPIHWKYVFLVAGIYLIAWVVLAVQFHAIAKRFGLKGSFGTHTRAMVYGEGYSRFFPFWIGNVATSAALEALGNSRKQASIVLYMSDVLVIFGTIVFGIIGLFVFGWKSMFLQMLWPFIIFGIAYFIYVKRARGSDTGSSQEANSWMVAARVFRGLGNDPLFLVRVGILALLCVLGDDLCPYFISRAFTSDNVLMNVDFFTAQNGVVAGYVARFIPVTPGGLGQYEWAFASALYMSGVSFSDSVTIALLDSAVRNITYFVGFWALIFVYGAETNFPTVLQMFFNSRTARLKAA